MLVTLIFLMFKMMESVNPIFCCCLGTPKPIWVDTSNKATNQLVTYPFSVCRHTD